jgi:hypothetical protein
MVTLPARHASLARLRLLKIRTDQSHLSRRVAESATTVLNGEKQKRPRALSNARPSSFDVVRLGNYSSRQLRVRKSRTTYSPPQLRVRHAMLRADAFEAAAAKSVQVDPVAEADPQRKSLGSRAD